MLSCVFTFLVLFLWFTKVRTKCTVISFKMLLEMFPLIYSFFCFIFNIYIIYIFCIKVKKKYFYCDFTSLVYLYKGDKINMTKPVPYFLIDGLSL